jgi:hypothetical protein
MCKTSSLPPGVVGDGVHDDTAGFQAALDSGAGTVYLPKPPVHYLTSQTLRIHSGQTLQLDRTAVIRLADHAHAHMLTNADPDKGNTGITVLGGIWDGNNSHQTCDYHEGKDCWVPYYRARYLGVLLQFDNVTDLRIAGLTLKDPETFGIQVGNLLRFTVEDITFDYNMLKLNMDGVHLHGNCRQGRIANLKGATNDDMVALNADDGWMFEISRGPIEDIVVDGLWADNGYTGVRLLSCGSPIRRVCISNIFGTFRYYVTSFTHHNAHPGERSEIADVLIDGVFCSKPMAPLARPLDSDEWARHSCPLFWVQAGTQVSNLQLANLTRRERLENAPPLLVVEKDATVEHLAIRQARVINEASTPLDVLVNHGTIRGLRMDAVHVEPENGAAGVRVATNRGEGAVMP